MAGEKTLKFAKFYGNQIADAIYDSNIFFETAIAQSCQESGYGTSPQAKNLNNFKGIRGKPKFANGTKGGWAVFPTPLDCFKSYAYFINNLMIDKKVNGKTIQVLRYKKALEAKTPEEQIYELVYAGYCMSPAGLSDDARAKNYLNQCKSYIAALRKYNIGGKVGVGGISLASIKSNINILNV